MTRLVFLIIFFLISLLSICKAPAYYLWILAILVTEYPLIFTGLTALLTLWGIWVTPYKVLGYWIGCVSMVLFLSPIARAYMVSADLRKEMSASFTGGGRPPIFPGRAPFNFGTLFKPAKLLPFTTFTYVKYKDISLTLDYYTDNSARALVPNHDIQAKPCVISVHGGSWGSGDSSELPDLNSYLVTRGYQVVAINYRLAPKYQSPAPIEDIKQVLNYLTAHANELHIDTNNFILLGRSAGAQIALLAAYTLHDPRIKGVINFYGPADMVWAYSIRSNPLIMDSRKMMNNYIGGPYDKVPEKYAACSPLEFVNDQTIPTLTIHGENDVLVSREHSRRLDLKLQQHNVRRYWLKLPWATHGFDYNLNGPGGQLSTFAVETFLNTVTQ